MRVLVTGAAGFIGNNVFSFLKELGHDVIGWDVNTVTEELSIVQVDLLNEKNVIRELQTSGPNVIIHCAGAADVGKSVTNPFEDYKRNVTATHNLLFALQKLQMSHVRVIFLSSAAVYGNPVSFPIKETAERKPLSPYALHKALCEDICFYFRDTYSMDIKILRIFSAYGAGLRKQIFWDMYQKINQTGKLEMFGTGQESRDYIYIDDLLQAITLITFHAPEEEAVYNIANGEELQIRNVAEAFADAVGLEKTKISFTGVEQVGAPLNWKADISKLVGLGYRKKVSFSVGVNKYVRWAKENETTSII